MNERAVTPQIGAGEQKKRRIIRPIGTSLARRSMKNHHRGGPGCHETPRHTH
jgi:hypothetical protein